MEPQVRAVAQHELRLRRRAVILPREAVPPFPDALVWLLDLNLQLKQRRPANQLPSLLALLLFRRQPLPAEQPLQFLPTRVPVPRPPIQQACLPPQLVRQAARLEV